MQPLVTSLSEPVTLWGTVKRWDGHPIPFASVALLAKPSFGKGQGLKQVIRCDERGHFRFVLSSPLDLEAYLLAYLPGVGIGWRVVPLDTSRECTLQLFPAAALWGRLDGVRKVALTIRQLRPLAAFPPVPPLRLESTSLDFFHTSTDERGAFLFPFLPDLCEAVIEVRALPFQFSALVGREVSVVIPPAGKLVGAVVGEDGKPKGKVPVQLVPVQVQVPEGGQILPLTLTTDEAGCFQALLPSGEWMVWLPGSGEAEWVSEPQCIFVPPNKTVLLSLTAQRPGIVRGWVADGKTRFPLPRLCVRAQWLAPTSNPFFPVVTEVAQQLPEGAYEVHLPKGFWQLFVADEGWQSEPVVVEVAEGAVIEAPAIFAHPAPKVRLTVMDEKGHPAKAFLADSTGRQGETDAAGVCEWQLPSSHPVLLVAAAPDFRSWAVVDLTNVPKTLTLRQGERVSGLVVDADGKPVEAALVQVWLMSEKEQSLLCLWAGRSDKEGRFTFFVPQGQRLQVGAQKDGKQVCLSVPPLSADATFRLTLDNNGVLKRGRK